MVLAKEAASLDLMSEGRRDFGLGAGWLTSAYEQTGIPLDPPGLRIERMAEALQIIKSFFSGSSVSFTGKHYKVDGVEAAPLPVQKPHPPILLRAAARRILHLAAPQADLLHTN